jgi:CheY-like chemotaxis protein
MVYLGLVSLMVPRSISHILNVCLIANREYRLDRAAGPGLSEKETVSFIQKEDELAAAYARRYQDKAPWDRELYDLLIPLDQSNVDAAVDLILDHTGKAILSPTARSLQAVHDFRLTAEVELTLSEKGYAPVDIKTSVREGRAVLEINKKSLRLKRLQEELKRLASGVAGIETVETKTGPNFHKADVVRKAAFYLPADVPLIDDEKPLEPTLSERLHASDIGVPVAYDGDQALEIVERENPDVIVMDLRMPGTTGLEIISLLKSKHPDLAVIIITGHGSDKERKKCLDLGTAAYFNKPADFESLSKAISEAQNRAGRRKETGS